MKFSEQALVACVIAFNQALIRGENIGELLRELEFSIEEDELWCLNPPTTLRIDNEMMEEE
jgi:hypothetical protein